MMFCSKHSITKKSKDAFGKELKELDFKDGRESKGENRKILWYGIRIKDEYVKSYVNTKVHSFVKYL